MIDLKNDYVISFLHGAVICPKFQFGVDGYIENYLNLDFYKWSIIEDKLYFYNPQGQNTAFINLSQDNVYYGFWHIQNIEIKLSVCQNIKILNELSHLKDFLTNTRWRFRSNNGSVISSNVWLCEDGLIHGYSHDNEYAWDVDVDGLIFLNKHGDITSRFNLPSWQSSTEQSKLTKGGRICLRGYLVDNPKHAHILEYLSGYSSNFLSELHYTSVLSGENSDILLVIFNGAGTPYDGIDTRWEFYHFPYQLGVDFIRFSELSPVAWYLDKTQSIYSILANVVKDEYQHVIFLGASAGGFASMYFAESLAQKMPHINCYTYVINPQTDIGKESRRLVVERFEQPLRPVLPSDFIFANKDTEIVNLKSFLEVKDIANMQHTVYFDSGNPCEQFYVKSIESPRVKLSGVPIYGGHADSGIKIFESHVLQSDVAKLVHSIR